MITVTGAASHALLDNPKTSRCFSAQEIDGMTKPQSCYGDALQQVNRMIEHIMARRQHKDPAVHRVAA